MNALHHFAAVPLLLGAICSAHAMSCAPKEPLTSLVSASDHVFVAQIKTATLSADKAMVEATFEVEEILKGSAQKVSTIQAQFSDYNYSTDGPQVSGGNAELSPGMHVLVFATGTGPTLYGPCTNTMRLRKHNDEIIRATRSAVGSK